jgi:hypothetical protein
MIPPFKIIPTVTVMASYDIKNKPEFSVVHIEMDNHFGFYDADHQEKAASMAAELNAVIREMTGKLNAVAEKYHELVTWS